MIKKASQLFLLSFLICGSSQAIEPGFIGPNGILEQVFTPNCLLCHSSERVGVARNDAPFGVDFDIFEKAKINGDEIIKQAVKLSIMPPKFSGLSLLDDEQKAALLAWQEAGFPEFFTQATFDFNTEILYLPLVLVGESVYQASLKLVTLSSSPLGYGFELISAFPIEVDLENQDVAENISVFDEITGEVTIPNVNKINNGEEETVEGILTLIMNSNPLLFSLDVEQTKVE